MPSHWGILLCQRNEQSFGTINELTKNVESAVKGNFVNFKEISEISDKRCCLIFTESLETYFCCSEQIENDKLFYVVESDGFLVI